MKLKITIFVSSAKNITGTCITSKNGTVSYYNNDGNIDDSEPITDFRKNKIFIFIR